MMVEAGKGSGSDARDEGSADPMALTQQMLQKACKRQRLSCNGTKKTLIDRLGGVGVTSRVEIQSLSEAFEINGPLPRLLGDGTLSKQRQPNWTLHEFARLCHVIADPRHTSTVAAMYQRPASRAELKRRRLDPWRTEFTDLFNDAHTCYDPPGSNDGVAEDLLRKFDPNQHPNQRTGEALRSKWRLLREKYAVARHRFSNPAQGECGAFSDFTEGANMISYMHCVFHRSPNLKFIMLGTEDGSRAEVGTGDRNIADRMRTRQQSHTPPSESHRTGSSASKSLPAGMRRTPENFAVPARIVQANVHTDDDDHKKISALRRSRDVADTVSSLLQLETAIQTRINDARSAGDAEQEVMHRGRLDRIRKRIDDALEC